MRFAYAFAAIAAIAMGSSALAADFSDLGPWQVRLRAVVVEPDASANVSIGGNVKVTDSVIPEADITYYFDKNWSVELIAGTTKHSVYHSSGAYLGSAWLLPPTLTAQYHFDVSPNFKPYVGAGLNYTIFYDTRYGALGKLKLSNNVGYALQLGADIPLGDQGYFLNVDVKKIFLSTHAKFTGAPVTASVSIDPWLIGVGVGLRF